MTGKNETRARLERLMTALPVLPDRRDGIAGAAERLYIVALLHRAGDLPRIKRTGSRAAVAELNKLARLARALAKHIKSMHREAFGALESQKGDAPHPLKLADPLFDLADDAERARGVMPATPPARGLNRKRQAEQVTKEAARVFEQLTGLTRARATRQIPLDVHPWGRSIENGLLSKFLTGVFEILRIDASAASQIKLLLQKKPR